MAPRLGGHARAEGYVGEHAAPQGALRPAGRIQALRRVLDRRLVPGRGCVRPGDRQAEREHQRALRRPVRVAGPARSREVGAGGAPGVPRLRQLRPESRRAHRVPDRRLSVDGDEDPGPRPALRRPGRALAAHECAGALGGTEVGVGMSAFTDQVAKGLACLRWLPAYAGQQLVRRGFRKAGPQHLIVALADHFEPSIVPGVSGRHADLDEQERRLERWCRDYPKMADAHRDGDGFPFRHTYFYPAEQFYKTLIDRLAEHCHDGWGEVEIHLHHGVDGPDTPDATRRVLVEFRDALAARGCLPRWNGEGGPRYAFVHGNWALANSAGGRYCGVDDEMAILAETGCYADLTLPAPLGLRRWARSTASTSAACRSISGRRTGEAAVSRADPRPGRFPCSC